MDIISVTDETLRNAYVILQKLDERQKTITSKCERVLSAQLSSLDEGLEKDIQKYINTIGELSEKLSYCIDENKTAIGERISKLPEYEHQTYKKRNIV